MTDYWLANILLVPKNDGKLRMCIDYKELNKASLNDDFPLPHIDVPVDNTTAHALFSFINGFSSYNQIRMALEVVNSTHNPFGRLLLQCHALQSEKLRCYISKSYDCFIHDMCTKS